MKGIFFEGNLVRLCAIVKEKDAELMAVWNRDSDYIRLLDIGPAYLYPTKQIQDWLDENNENQSEFMIETIAENKRIGFVGLDEFNWAAGTAWVGIGIGDPDYRGKGYGTEAMKLILKYAFNELNLHRVNLGVFEFNERAIKSYKKCGYKYEGTERELIFKDDKRWDVLNMGILRSDWEALHRDERE